MTFDEILVLIDRLNQSSLSEIKISDGDQTVRLRRGSGGTVSPDDVHSRSSAEGAGGVGAGAGTAGPVGATPAADASDGAQTADGREQITSPIVGTFYRSPAPDSPPFAEEGDEVKTGGALCIIEAMKVMNELEADFDLRVERVLVENGEMVEYGTPLLEVTRL
jgi:acetyl-CoA carboxylase biotin carboxyl carrier protein